MADPQPEEPSEVRPLVALCDWLATGREPDGPLNTEFLGDLYQHWSLAARKGRALVQTPDFVRSLILDRTHGEALKKWGPPGIRMIDPTCGCGHFLVDGFRRTFDAWMALDQAERGQWIPRRPGETDAPEEALVAQVVLDQVFGVDLDPACVAIARVRLLFEAWRVSDVRMPYRVQVHQGDALLHHRPMPGDDVKFGPWPYDVAAVRRVLVPGQYSVVVGNPPYITCKDATLSAAYRERYPTCHWKYSLAVPFTEVFFGLAAREIRGREAGDTIREEQDVLFADPGKDDTSDTEAA